MRKILLIEDNDDHAAILKLKLPAFFSDIKLIHFATLAHAKLVWQQNPEEYFAVILDLNLPDSDRQETIEFINKLQDNTPVIIHSGADKKVTESLNKEIYFVQKPDTSGALIEILNKIIQGATHGDTNA